MHMGNLIVGLKSLLADCFTLFQKQSQWSVLRGYPAQKRHSPKLPAGAAPASSLRFGLQGCSPISPHLVLKQLSVM